MAGDEDGLEFAAVGSGVVRDAVHDVGAAEALGVLEGCGVKDVAGLEVDEVHGDCCGSDVGGDA